MKLEIEISEETKKLIEEFLKRVESNKDPHSPGSLTMKRLAEMLMTDVGQTIGRPGSWESANMINVLQSHGYDVF